MGNTFDSRSQFNGGYIYVKTDRPYYYPGNEVFGKIYIRLDRPMNASHIELRIKGKENSSFWEEEQRDQERVRVKRKRERKIMEWKGTCFTF